MKVLLDTNALLIPFQFKLDIYSRIKVLIPKAEVITLSECVEELKKKKPRVWKSVIDLGLQKGLRIIETLLRVKTVDDEILEYAQKHKCLVFTQDRVLKKKLLNASLRVIIMRQRKYLKVIG